MIRSAKLILAAAAVTLCVGVGCSEQRAAAPEPAAPKKSSSAAEKTTTSSEASPYPYAYNPLGKRDPFRSPVEELRASGSGENTACSEPLCQWDLDQLTLVAVVTGDANPFAMVEDPQGRGYIVRRNSKIGKQGGKVTNILRDSITVTEYWQRPESRERVPNPVTKKLMPDEKGIPSMDLISGKMIE